MAFFKLEKIDDAIWKLEESNISEHQETNLCLYSSVDKGTEISKVLSTIDFRYHSNFVVFGIKNIELISEVYKNKTPFSTLIVIEITDDNFINLECEKSQLEFLSDKSVNLVIGNGNTLLHQLRVALSSMLKQFNLRNLKFISMPYIKSLYPDEIQSIIKNIFEIYSTDMSSFGNDVEDILKGMDNYVNNWQHTFRGTDYKYFENAYEGQTAIIIGAGPSLDKSIKYLKNIKGKALILCVDAAMDVLLDEGIIPDIVASIERTESTVRLYQRVFIPQEIVYVGANQIPGAILNRMNKIIFTGRSGDGLFKKFNESLGLTNLNIGNNVSHILVSFAQFLGCSTVIFTGLDLAYPQGVTHAKRTLDNFTDKMKAGYKNDMVYVKGQNGEILETQEYFMHTRIWIENYILANKKCKYINSSEGGANIVGTQNLNIKDSIIEFCNDRTISSFTELYDTISCNHIINKMSMTEKAIDFFNDLIIFYDKVYNLITKYIDRLKKEQEYGILIFMEKQRYELNEVWKENTAGYFILQSIIIKYNRDIHAFPMYLEKEDEIKMKYVNMKYYGLLRNVIERVKKDIYLYIDALKFYLRNFELEGGNLIGHNQQH